MKQVPWVAFSIDRNAPTPVFEQICHSIREQAASGALPAGSRLPPTRVFATELGVSRSTIVTAYEQLVAEGYLKSLRGSGFTVCQMGPVELQQMKPQVRQPDTKDQTASPRPFQAGLPDMRLFPHKQWARTVSRICRTNPESMLVGDTNMGNMALREAVAAHVSEWRGIEAAPQQILITAGSGDALEVCLRALTHPGDKIGLEDPGYLPLYNYVSASGLTPTYLNIDQDGAVLEPTAQSARLVVLTPSHQFPLGGAMAPSRRLEFIRWAEENNRWIIEDDYDSEFRYAGRPIPAMAGFNQLSRTIYIGSFSKVFSNSLRLVYLIVPTPLIDRFGSVRQRYGVKASYMPQQALADFMTSGEFYRHLRRMRRVYAERRKVLIDQLTGAFGQFGSCEDHQAGMQVAFHLDPPLPDTRIAQEAERAGLSVAPLSRFSHRDTPINGLLLGFCAFTPDEMGSSLATLKQVLCNFTGPT